MNIPLHDRFERVISYLRVSVTDRCNFRCVYCLPEEVQWTPREEILSFEEIARVVGVGATLRLSKVRLTGGEPTVRGDLPRLVSMLREISGVRELAMTTNASRLRDLARPLRDAGLDRVNISLDTLRPERAQVLARRDFHAQVLEGIEAAREIGLPMKFNTVVMRGQNDDELCDLLSFAHERGAQARFIEWMPMGAARFNARNQTVPEPEMRARLSERFDLAREDGDERDPARGWRCQRTGARVAFISSMSDAFCATCNRMRLTAQGGLRPCLHQDAEVPLREVLRGGASDGEVAEAFRGAAALKWSGHRMTDSVPLYSQKEMISIGG